MRATLFKNKWLVLLLLAVALAGMTKLLGGAQRAATPPPEPIATPSPEPTPSATAPAPDATETVEASDDDLIDDGLGMDSSGTDPSPKAEPTENSRDPDGDESASADGPVDPVGIDPTPIDE